MRGYIIGLLGVWIFSDGLYSLLLYLNTPGIDGKRLQTWKRDHWLRVVRAGIGIALIVIGATVL